MTSVDPTGRRPILGLNRRARWLLPLLLLVLAGLTLFRLRDPSHTDVVELTGTALGTTWFVKVVAPGLAIDERDEMLAAVYEQLDAVDRRMSTWDPDSELSKFNRSKSTAPFPVSKPTLEVFGIAREVSERTGGAFDVTVGPLVRAWGFGADAEPLETTPDEGKIARLRDHVGYRSLSVDPVAGTLRKEHVATEADLSAIAKGYAVDRIADALEGLGWRNVLVEVGGELGARGTRSDGGPWRVAVERPDTSGRSIFAIVELRNTGMATSGDYRSYILRDGVRLSHLIDPRSMRPIHHALASVSVIDPNTARADALATGLSVLGPEAGPALAEREEIAAYFIVREPGDKLRGFASKRFAPFLAGQQPDPDKQDNEESDVP